MNLKSMKFNDKETPKRVTVSMSIEEAAYLAKLTGGTNHFTADSFMPEGGEHNNEIYYTLTSVFNTYWDGGVDDFIKETQ